MRSIGSLASSSKESTDQPVKTVCTNLEETEGPPDQELSDTGVVNVGYLELTALDAAARGSRWSLSRAKRALDIALSLPILIIAAVPMVVIGLCARLSSRGPAIFVQQRGFHPGQAGGNQRHLARRERHDLDGGPGRKPLFHLRDAGFARGKGNDFDRGQHLSGRDFGERR